MLSIAVLIPIVRHYQLRAATNAYIAKLKAQGEPMELAQIVPPAVPPDQNSADTAHKVAELIDADQSLFSSNTYSGMKLVARGKAMVCYQQPRAVTYEMSNSWADIAAAVAQNKECFDLLYSIVEKPKFGVQIAYEQGGSLTNLNLPHLKEASARLHTAALLDLRLGDTASATQNLRSVLAIVKAMRDERLAICQLVRIAIAQNAIAATWEFVQSPKVTQAQLAALQNDWQSIEFIPELETTFEAERFTMIASLKKWRGSNSEFERFLSQIFDMPGAEAPRLFKNPLELNEQIFRWRYWWSYSDELKTLKGYQLLLGASRAAQTNDNLGSIQTELNAEIARLAIPTNTDPLFDLQPDELDLHNIFCYSVPGLARELARTIKMEAAKRFAATAIALKGYHLAHRNYPSNLTALVPEFLQKVPSDPIDGKPLRYRLNSDGTFLLYSLGEDGNDDGGDAGTPDNSRWQYWLYGRDWVWPQPATAEEIQSFYKNPPK